MCLYANTPQVQPKNRFLLRPVVVVVVVEVVVVDVVVEGEETVASRQDIKHSCI